MAQTTSGILFGPFRLDVAGARLWRADEAVQLQPRPLAVLMYLAMRPGAVVSRDELISTLWAGTHVTKAVLKVAVRAIREALEDHADMPRYIETVGHEGYRFVGGGAIAHQAVGDPAAPDPEVVMVGRGEYLARLHASLAQAMDGERSIVFVTGEAGVGKTSLLDRFVAEVDPAGGVCVARGQCLEQYGEGEAYLPVLEAVGRLVRNSQADELRDTLSKHAPTWVSQLAALEAKPPTRRRRETAISPMPVRMLREMADALEVYASRRPLMLVLEDLQWSDPSTVDLIACIARRREPARLLVVGTLRPVEMAVDDHPLRGIQLELQAKGLCEELPLELLSLDDVAAYLEARFGGVPANARQRLAARVHERTEGHALFMVNMVNDLVASGLLVRRDQQWQVNGSIETATERIPSGLQELIGRSLQDLSPTVRQMLEGASVVGDEFVVAAVAAALEAAPETVEDACEQLAAQRSVIVDAGVAEWPDGSVTGRYRFRHALYRRVLYEGIAPARRVRLHRAVGKRQEAGYGPRAFEHAAELAMHYARGHAHARALHFHELAAAAALDRHAAHEAVAHCTAALEALPHTPDKPDRASRELALVVAQATLLMATKGYAAPETERAYARARVLCDAAPAGPQLFAVLRGLVSYHQVRAAFDEALNFGEQLLRHAGERKDDRVLRVQAHYGQGTTLFHVGALADARTHLEVVLRDYDPRSHRQHVLIYGGYDPAVASSLWLSWILILQGELEKGAACERDGLALAQKHGEAFSLAWVHQGVSVSRQLLGDWAASEAAAAEAMRLAEEHGFAYVLAMATANRGWALIMRGQAETGVPMLREGVAMVERTGAGLVRPSHLGMLAAAHVMEGNRKAALDLFDEALTELERTGERVLEAPLLIGKSNLIAEGGDRSRLSRAAANAAEECLRRALEVARAQGARLTELRAAVALARHCRERGRRDEARAPLAAAYAWFADRPSDAAELASAQRLLAALQSG